MAGKTNKLDLQFDKNPIEAIREIGADTINSVKSSVRHDLLEQSVTSAWNQLIGDSKDSTQNQRHADTYENPYNAGDLNEGQEISFKKVEKIKTQIEPGINYSREIIHAEKTIRTVDENTLTRKIEEITFELKKLTQSSKELQVKFKNVTVETLPQNPGKYHLNFFEWMLLAIQTARLNIESSATWSTVVTGKKGKRDFWNMAKKHGTSFSLSSERAVAQQVG